MSVMSRLKWVSFTQGELHTVWVRTATLSPSMVTDSMPHSGRR